jgi:hypothetical protein
MKWPASTKTFLMAAAVLAACIGFVVFFSDLHQQQPPVTLLPPADAVKRVEKVDLVPAAPLKVYKPAAKTKLNLPAAIKADPAAHVTATGKLTARDNSLYSLTAVLDANTGESAIYAERGPLPWLSARQSGQVTVSYGLRGSEPMGRLAWSHAFLSVKALDVGLTATIDQDGAHYAGVGIGWRY